MHRTLPLAFALLLLTSTHSYGQPKYPPPEPPKDKSGLGVGIQRTMNLLATSTPQHRNKVRILFYGQSITEQDWWKAVADDLRKRFPDADLEIENRAIGGFASQKLIKPAEHDLYPFYPDLLIFHVYGAHTDYEQIIKNVRSRTAAEVMMQTDHVNQWVAPDATRESDQGGWWSNFMNNEFLPKTAKKYGCALVPVRDWWADYLKANELEPKALLRDGVHLNDHGNYLMAQLVSRYLVHRPDLTPPDDLVKTLVVGKDVQWTDGKLTLPFDGNRVDVISSRKPGTKSPVVHATIDGQQPSDCPGTYRITRPTPGPWSPLALVRVDHAEPLVVENWTLTLTNVRDGGKQWDYAVEGSKTGPDGTGSSDKTFTSKSGRVQIQPDSWFRAGGDLKPGYKIQWQVRPMHADEFTPPEVADPAREYAVTVAQGLPNERHTLTLTADGEPDIQAIRIYRPPVR